MKKRNKIKAIKSSDLEFEALVIEAHPGGMFRLQLRNEHKLKVIGVLSGKMRQNFITVVPGDFVVVELSEYDLSRGRIVKRLRNKY